MTFVVTGELVFDEANLHSCYGLSAKWPSWALASEHLVPRSLFGEIMGFLGCVAWPAVAQPFLCSCDVPGLLYLYCRIFKTFPSGLGLKMWAERKLSHLSCFCQTFCHNEKSNDSFSHLDTGKRSAPSCCALWLSEMVGHFPPSTYGWSPLPQSRGTGGSHAVQT